MRARLLALGVLTACSWYGRGPLVPSAVTGTVSYRDRMALPPEAELRLELLDASAPDTSAGPVADTTIQTAGRQVPLPFTLRFDPQRIEGRHLYALRATIVIAGQPTYVTPTTVNVVTWDHPTIVDLVLARASR